MGTVYKARQNELDRFIALKILPPGVSDDPSFAERFGHEALAIVPQIWDALLITSVRRDYFLVIQKGKLSGRVIRMEDLPAKDATLDGIAWLPHIIPKARAKLRGEMLAELMFGCGGDRKFLQSANIHPADFLRLLWSAGDDDRKIIAYVKKCRARLTPIVFLAGSPLIRKSYI